MSPVWWHVWQCCWKMRTTSLLNVGPCGMAGCTTARCRAPMNVSATTAIAKTARTRLSMIDSVGPSPRGHQDPGDDLAVDHRHHRVRLRQARRRNVEDVD